MNEAFDCLTQLEQQQNPKISLTSQAPSHFDCSQQSIDRTAQNEMCAEYYAALTAQPNTTREDTREDTFCCSSTRGGRMRRQLKIRAVGREME